MTIVLINSFTNEINSQNWVRPRRVLVQLMTSRFSISHTFLEHSYQILLTSALNHHQVFHKESVFHIPSLMQNTRRGIQEISKLLIVNFKERGLDIKLLWFYCHSFPHVANRPWKKPIIFIRCPSSFSPNFIFDSRHSVRLTWTSLSISENGSRVTIKGRIKEFL